MKRTQNLALAALLLLLALPAVAATKKPKEQPAPAPVRSGPDKFAPLPEGHELASVWNDPDFARRLVGSFDYPDVGEFKALAIPYKFLGWDNPEIGAPPTLGQHTEALLAELGLSRERIAELREKRAI